MDRDATDLDEAIHAGRQAVDATPPNDPDSAKYLSNLGNFLSYRSERTGNVADLDEAIEAERQVVEAIPP